MDLYGRIVLYAGECGGQGLDMEDLLTREEVYNLTITSNEKFMDSPTPFIPESQFYRVVSIKEGIYHAIILQ